MKTNGSFKPLNKQSLAAACRSLASSDEHLARVYEMYGTPPLWDRPQGFDTLLRIILEQQVSLASAKACFDKLCVHLGTLTPESLLSLNDAELKKVGFSRQKAAYGRHLAEAVLEERIDLHGLSRMPDADAKLELIKLKGVGEWTSDIYLIMALLRPDVMPRGDIALHTAWHRLAKTDIRPDSDEFLRIAERWKPYRSSAARLLWHFYLSEKRNGKS